MSAPTATPPSTAVPPFVSPIIQAYADSIKPAMTFLMIGTVFASMLVPLLAAVLYLSNAKVRRQSIFMLVIFVILLGLTLGFWNGVVEVRAIVAPLDPQPESEFFAFEIAYSLTPWIVDLVLFFRLLAVYNPKHTRASTLISVMAFPVAIKVLRLAMVIIFAVQWHRDIGSIGNAVLAAEKTWRSSFCVKVEWVAQIFDNAYASAMFMYRLRGSMKMSQSSAGAARDTVGRRIRTLFWIAATNFVFPVLFNLAQIIAIFNSASFFVGAYLMMVNTYLSILGVVFATVWSSSANLRGESQSTLLQSDGIGTGGRISFKTPSNATRTEAISHPRSNGTLHEGAWVTQSKSVNDVPMTVFIGQTKAVTTSEDGRSV